MPVETECVGCGLRFYVPPSRAVKGARFHSLQCYGAWKTRPIEERFWAKVQKSDGCWEWIGDRHEFGYGRLWISDVPRRYVYAHRFSYEMTNGPIGDDDLDVLHRCDNPPCVRPDHLWLGDQRENSRDRDSKDRVRHGSKHANAKLTEKAVTRARTLYATGAISKRALAKAFEVSPSTMDDAIDGKTWRRA